MSNLTLEDIAKLAGVSRSTVSRVVNDDPNVNEKVRKRVQEVIQNTGYQPHAAARSLAGGRTHILGLVIPEGVTRLFSDPYFPILIQGVSLACNSHDYSVMLWLAEPEYERRTIRNITQNKITDGIIVASMLYDDPLVDALLQEGQPFVLVGRHPEHDQISYVDVDNQNGARLGVSHLLRLGYRRIAHISGPLNMIAGIDRQEGYKQALRQWGLAIENDLVVEGDFSEEGGYAAAQSMLRATPRSFDALFAASDAMAIGALRAFRDHNLKVPRDVALLGFDDIPMAASINPKLTTIRQPIQKNGMVAAETLIDMIQFPEIGPQRVILPTELVIRDSCGASLNNGHQSAPDPKSAPATMRRRSPNH